MDWEQRPGDRVPARAHFQIALAGIIVPMGAFLLSGGLAIYHLVRPSAGPDDDRWRVRLAGLAIVDFLALLSMKAILAGRDAITAPAAAPPPEHGIGAGLWALFEAWAAVALVLGLACIVAARRRAEAPGIAPLRFWAAFMGVLGCGDAALVAAVLVAQWWWPGLGPSWVTLISLVAATGTMLGLGAALRAMLLGAGEIARDPPRAATLPTVVIGVAYLIAGGLRAALILSGIALRFGLPPADPGRELKDLVAAGLSPPGIAAFVLAVAVIAPIAEEILFRGALLPWLCRFMRPEAAVVLSAAIFGVGHFRYGIYLVVIGVYGVVLGWARMRTGNLRASIALHVIINGVATAVALLRH